jgi:hypothetical protein
MTRRRTGPSRVRHLSVGRVALFHFAGYSNVRFAGPSAVMKLLQIQNGLQRINDLLHPVRGEGAQAGYEATLVDHAESVRIMRPSLASSHPRLTGRRRGSVSADGECVS